MDILIPVAYNLHLIDKVARLIGADNVKGITTGPYGTRIDLEDDTPPNIQTLLNNLFANLNTLPVITDLASIDADDVDTATITLVSVQASLEYLVLLDGEEYSTGTVIPSAGTATLTLATALPGTYTVILINPDGSATGQVQIIAS